MATKSGSSVRIPNVVNISIRPRDLIRILFIVGVILLSLQLIESILTLFVAFIIMAATKPAAVFLSKRLRLPEGLSIVIVFLLIFVVFGGIIYLVSKPLATEVARFADSIPTLSDNLVNWLSTVPLVHTYFDKSQLTTFFDSAFNNLANQFNSIANALGSAIIGAFQGILVSLSVLIFAIYLFLERDDIKDFVIRLFKFNKTKFRNAYDVIESQLGAWVRGQLLLCFSVGFATYIGLVLLDVKYALPLAILAGILEIVPIIGPTITAIIVTIVGLSISPITGLLTFLLGLAVQQLENNFLVPVIMKRAVGLSPVVTILSLLIGQQLFGVIGAIIAVPTAAMIVVLVSTYLDERDNKLARKHAQLDALSKA